MNNHNSPVTSPEAPGRTENTNEYSTMGESLESLTARRVELLAEYAHDAWARYIEYLLERVIQNADGSVTIPAPYVSGLLGLASTAFAELSDKQKELDRHEARKMLMCLE